MISRRVRTNPDQIHADITAYFLQSRFDMAPEERRAKRRMHTTVSFGDYTIDYYDMVGGDLSGVGRERYSLGFTARGNVLVRQKKGSFYSAPSIEGAFNKPYQGFSLVTQPRSKGYMFSVAPIALIEAGRVLCGDGFILNNVQRVNLKTKAAMAFMRNVVGMFNELNDLEGEKLGALATVSYIEMLTNLAVAALCPDLWHSSQREAKSIAPRTVSMAREMLAARAMHPLSIGEVAVELGVTSRALQIGFRKHFGVSPLQFVLLCRLKAAHAALQQPSITDTVQSVARQCGFVDMGKFAHRYKAKYNELPSETLARGLKSYFKR